MRGSDDCGQAVCAIDYATLIRDFAHRLTEKPRKNRELGGSGDTCIDGTRQGAAHKVTPDLTRHQPQKQNAPTFNPLGRFLNRSAASRVVHSSLNRLTANYTTRQSNLLTGPK
jgi:hypothetical protein